MGQLFNLSWGTTLLTLAIGLVVGGLVYVLSLRVLRGRRALLISEEDLPWNDLLEMLKMCPQKLGTSRPVIRDELSPDDLHRLLVHLRKSKSVSRETALAADEARHLHSGPERRKSSRRWFNPIEVRIISFFHERPLHGLVVNRSTGGLAVLCDVEFAADAVLNVIAVDAAPGTPLVELVVRHVRPAAKLWLLGCEYQDEIPWNVKVWFG